MSRHYRYNGRRSKAERQNLIGAAMLAASVAGFAALFGFAYAADKANGITVSQSLASAGFGHASPYRPTRQFAGNVRAAINGRRGTHWRAKGCDGQGALVYHADYIDEFPAGCAEFVLVRNDDDSPIKSLWADEMRRELGK